jgi:hypothetical protein
MTKVHELHAPRTGALSERDRRRFRRVPLKLEGRFLDGASEEHAFLTSDVSCGGAGIVAKTRPAIGAVVVCYFDALARIAARVTRHTAQGFVVEFSIPRHKREKIADRLTWLLNAERLGLTEDRAAERFPAGGPAIVVRADGTKLRCRALDISLTGAGFEAESNPPFVGEIVTAGSIKARVVRREHKAFAVSFIFEETRETSELADLARRHRERAGAR